MGGFPRIVMGLFALLSMSVAAADSPAAPIHDLPNDAVPPRPAGESPDIQKAIAAFHRGDVEESLRWLDEARQENPQLSPSKVMLANMYFSDNLPTQGRQTLEQAAVDNPLDPEPHLIFGDIAWQQGRLSDAETQYLRGRELVKSYDGPAARRKQLAQRTLVGLASVAEARRQYEVSERLFSDAIKLEPAHGNAHYRLGNVLFALGRPEEAFKEFQKAAELTEAVPSATLTMAGLYEQAGDKQQTGKWLERAIAAAPNQAGPQLAMARWQLAVLGDGAAADRFARGAETRPNVGPGVGHRRVGSHRPR